MPTTNFGRREEAIVQDFGTKALRLRDALMAARGHQGKDNGNGNADVQDADAQDAAAAGDDQTAQDAAQGKGKNTHAQNGTLLNDFIG
jgi:hypothetical protein